MARRRLALVFVLLAAASVHGSAEPPFADEHLFAAQDGVSSVAVADLDRDGFEDVAASSLDSDMVRIRFGGSSPIYLTLTTSFDNACFVVVADIDGDGWIDVVGGARGSGTNQVRWWQNPGPAGTWTLHPVSASHFDQARSLEVADLDSDGDADILVAGVDGAVGYVSWFENGDGSGTTWALHDVTSGFAGAHDVAVGDINGNGLLDVVATAYDLDAVAWFQNDGSIHDPGVWTAHVILEDFDGALPVNVADMDQDGDLDVVAGAFNDAEVVWIESNGGLWTPHPITSSLAGVYTAQPVDMDQDGHLDVLATGRSADTLVWYRRSSSPYVFTSHSIDTACDGVRSAVATDFDHDGDPDIVAAVEFDDHAGWWENLSHHRRAAFPDAEVLATGVDYLGGLNVVDIDRDGSPDLVDHRRSGDTAPDIVIWRQTTGSWVPTTVVSDFDGPTSATVVDLDRDGDLDIVAAAIYSESVGWFENTGGAWAEHLLATGYEANSVAVGDLDCDGDPDILSTYRNGHQADLWWNNGDATSWTMTTMSATFDAWYAWLNDMVGDAAPDLVIGGSNDFDVWENRLCSGGGWVLDDTFHEQLSDVTFGDFDGDGRTDFAITQFNDSTIKVYLEPGAWNVHTVAATLDGPNNLRAADMDLDGDIDLVSTSYYGAEVAWWENSGNGIGWTERTIASLGSPAPLAVGDLDLDGDPDVVSGNWASDEIHIFDNTGGHFGTVFEDISPFVLEQGDTAALFSLEYSAFGRADDLTHELRRVLLGVYSASWEPFTAAQGSDLFANVVVWHDGNGNGSWEPGVDTEVYRAAPAVVSGGYLDLAVATGPDNPDLPPTDGAGRFFVGVELTPDAAAHEPGAFRVIAYSSSDSSLGYADFPAFRLHGEPGSAAQTPPITIGGGLPFSDGFESGDTSNWSATAP